MDVKFRGTVRLRTAFLPGTGYRTDVGAHVPQQSRVGTGFFGRCALRPARFDARIVRAARSKQFTKGLVDIVLFAAVSGDNNAVHIDEEFSRTSHPHLD